MTLTKSTSRFWGVRMSNYDRLLIVEEIEKECTLFESADQSDRQKPFAWEQWIAFAQDRKTHSIDKRQQDIDQQKVDNLLAMAKVVIRRLDRGLALGEKLDISPLREAITDLELDYE